MSTVASIIYGEDNVKIKQLIRGQVGQSVTISCWFKPEQESFSVTWMVGCKDESLFYYQYYKNKKYFSIDRLDITITNLTEEDSGIYHCNIKRGKVTRKGPGTMLYVTSPFSPGQGTDPRIIVEQPAVITTSIGSTVTIQCNVTFQSPSFSVYWSLGCEDRTSLNKNNRVSFDFSKHKITIKNLTEHDSGKYCCHVETAEGKSAKGNGTRLEVMKTFCPAECQCKKGNLLLAVEILRVISIIVLIVLLSIVIKKSC